MREHQHGLTLGHALERSWGCRGAGSLSASPATHSSPACTAPFSSTVRPAVRSASPIAAPGARQSSLPSTARTPSGASQLRQLGGDVPRVGPALAEVRRVQVVAEQAGQVGPVRVEERDRAPHARGIRVPQAGVQVAHRARP